jgi:hypothetical protein
VGRKGHSEWLVRVFGDALPQAAAPRHLALGSLFAITDVGTWKLLRRDLGYTRAETTSILQAMVRAILPSPTP